MTLAALDHEREAFGIDPVVGLDDLAELALGADRVEGAVVVGGCADELVETQMADARVSCRESLLRSQG